MDVPSNIDEFIQAQPSEQRPLLESVRHAIRTAAPGATETISYGIPTFKLNGKSLLHFGAGKHHIGLYATPDGHQAFEAELAKYKRGKGSVQFPLEQPLPLDLIRRIAEYRVKQVMNKEV